MELHLMHGMLPSPLLPMYIHSPPSRQASVTPPSSTTVLLLSRAVSSASSFPVISHHRFVFSRLFVVLPRVSPSVLSLFFK